MHIRQRQASPLDLYLRLVSVRIRGQMQYRASFLLEAFTTAIASGVSFLTIALVLQKFTGIGGWSLGEVALLYGIVETAFGVMDMLFGGFDPSNFGAQVRLGSFDQMLLRPVNITLQVFASEFILRRLGRIFQGGVVFVIALYLLDIQWTAVKLIFVPIVFLSQIAFFGGLFIIGAAITFWTVESIEVVNIFTYGGTEMMSYPMHIYQDWMRYIFTYIIPAIFLNYYPALYLLGKPDPFHMPVIAPFLAPAAGFGILAAALVFWRFGVQHYQSTGT
ncbi:MAG: ABC-2 family transporter protein [Anaerolineales bacterium]|nr:ABC-2 family transporter protein [Anaerolineales bacterium]